METGITHQGFRQKSTLLMKLSPPPPLPGHVLSLLVMRPPMASVSTRLAQVERERLTEGTLASY